MYQFTDPPDDMNRPNKSNGGAKVAKKAGLWFIVAFAAGLIFVVVTIIATKDGKKAIEVGSEVVAKIMKS